MVFALLLQAAAPPGELTVRERGRIWVEEFGDVASVEWRTAWVRGRGSRLEMGAAMDPTFVHLLVPPLEASVLLVETPEHLAGRVWVANLPPIAKGFVVPAMAFRAERRGDPLALPPEFPLRLLCDRLLLRATLEPEAWAAKGPVSLKELLGPGALLARLPLGDLTRRFTVDPATRRLKAIELEIPLTAERAVLQIVHRAESWREVEGMALPSPTTVTVRWGREDDWTRVLQLSSEIERVEARAVVEMRGVEGAPAALGGLLDKPADPYARAFWRIKEEVVSAINEGRLPNAMATDLRRDLEEAVRAEPANPHYAAAYLELVPKGDLRPKLRADLPEAAILLGKDLDRALETETFPFLRRKLEAARSGALAVEGPFEERRRHADAVLRAMKRPTSEGIEALLAAHRARVPADPLLHYVAAVAAARAAATDPFLKAVVRMSESPEAVRAAADLIRPHLLEGSRLPLEEMGVALRPVAERLVAADPGDPFGHVLLAEGRETAEEAAPHLDEALKLLEKQFPFTWTPERVMILAKAAVPPEGDEVTDRMKRAARLYLACAQSDWELIPDEMRYDESNPAGAVAAALVKAGELDEALGLIEHPGFLPGLDYSYGVWEAVQESGAARSLLDLAQERLADGKFRGSGCVALVQGIEWYVGLDSEEVAPFLREAVKRHPGEPMLWFFQGQMGGDAMLDSYRQALALWESRSGRTGAQENYAINQSRLLLARGVRASDPAAARRLLKKFDFASANAGYFAMAAVRMLIEDGVPSEAVELLRPHEKNPQLLLDLAIALEADGKLLEAWKTYARAVETEARPEMQYLYNHHNTGGREKSPARRMRDEFAGRVNPARLMELFFAQSFEPVTEAERAHIGGLVGKLRAEEIGVRDAAQRDLKAMGCRIAPVLRGSLADPDPEAAARVRSLIDGWMFE